MTYAFSRRDLMKAKEVLEYLQASYENKMMDMIKRGSFKEAESLGKRIRHCEMSIRDIEKELEPYKWQGKGETKLF